MFKGLVNVWCNEPVIFIGALQALVAVVTAFGLALTPNQTASLMAAAAAIGALIARSRVSPN
jgi:hypothetical protein